MQPPDRLSVPTCVGCGAMSRLGTCETGCSEHKLELVRAPTHDTLVAAAAERRARVAAFSDVLRRLAYEKPGRDQLEGAYRSAQRAARDILRQHQNVDEQAIDLNEPADHATTWWCAECGGVDAPQPCLGICVWRPVEWVERGLHEELRELALTEYERELHLRGVLQRIAWITPRPGHWEQGWRLLQAEARQLLDAQAMAA